MKLTEFYRLAKRRKIGYNQGNHTYYVKFQIYQAKEILRELKKRNVSLKNKKVLELAAGFGGYSLVFRKHSKEFIANDIKEPFATRFDKDLKYKEFSVTDKFPFKDNSFDFIFCCSLIEHINNPNKMLSEIKRVLKPNGLLYLSFPPFYSPVGGHYFKPFHLFGEKIAVKMVNITKKNKIKSFKDSYDDHGLYVRTISSVKRLLIKHNFQITSLWTRFLPINFAKIPFINEFLTWHVCFLCKNKKN